jgi:DNA topoisomerase-1
LKNAKITDIDKTEITGADRNKLISTDIGTVVNDFLMEYFPGILDYNFTAKVEKEFDSVAEGTTEWTKMMKNFYKGFHPTVEAAASVKTERKVGERELGQDPKSGKPVFVKIGKYGPIAQIGIANTEDKKEKPQFASLLKGQSIETITLDEALKLFDLPRTVGQFEGEDIIAAIGRFGPFIRHSGKFFSIPKDFTAQNITKDEALELIKIKREKEQEKYIKKFDNEPDLEILNGRFGPYIAYKGKNYKIPKGSNPAQLTLAESMAIIANTHEKSTAKRRFAKKK